MSLEQEFEKEMRNIYQRCVDEIGNYKPVIFLSMIKEMGAVATARKLIMRPNPSDGYTRLWKEGRLDLTAEALLVKNNQFHSTELFPDIELVLKKARTRLREFGFYIED